jgi:steroid 5-alpha reductase family enzyme
MGQDYNINNADFTSPQILENNASIYKPNFTAAIIVGALTSIACAIVWAVITVITENQYAIVAIIFGLAVGLAIRYAGRGTTIQFGILSALLSLLACVLGDYLAVVGFIAEGDTSYFKAMTMINISGVFSVIVENFNVLTLLFYGAALYVGFKTAINKEN